MEIIIEETFKSNIYTQQILQLMRLIEKYSFFPSHDQDQEAEEKDNGDQYDMIDYHIFEMPDTEHYPKEPREV